MNTRTLVILLLACALSGCALTVEQVDYSWPFESVIKTDANGLVQGDPKTLAFNLKAIVLAETGKDADPSGRTVRIIRDRQGYYYLTSHGFKNVFIFSPDLAALKLKKQVLVDEKGLDNPFFNQRTGWIELGSGDRTFKLDSNGLVGGK